MKKPQGVAVDRSTPAPQHETVARSSGRISTAFIKQKNQKTSLLSLVIPNEKTIPSLLIGEIVLFRN